MSQNSLGRRSFVGTVAGAVASARALGASDRVNVGLIGVGGRGMDHVEELIGLKDLNIAITAVCDVFRPNLAAAAAAVERGFGAKPEMMTDYRRLLDSKHVDAVVIATPDFGHPIILMAAVETGKDAYVEKPFAINLEDAKAAYLAVKKSGRVVAVGTQRRSDGRFIAAARQVQTGVLGKVTRVEFAMNVQAPRWKRRPEKVDRSDVDWESFQLGRLHTPFDPRLLREWQLFAGVTTNGIPGLWMSHYIDLVPWFLGDLYPAGAVSNGGVYLWKDGRTTTDVFYTLLDYPSEFVVMFTMSLTNAAGIRNVWYGTKGTLDCEKWILSGSGSEMQDRIAGETRLAPEPASSHMQNFIECIRSRQKPRADVQAGFSHSVAGIMAAEALRRGRRIQFDATRLEMT